MEKSNEYKGFLTLISVVSSLMLLYQALTGWGNQLTVVFLYVVFLGICLVYYITRETAKSRKKVNKTAIQPVVHVNLFEQAVNKGETVGFLLGEGNYYLPGKTIQGAEKHMPDYAFKHVEGYGKRFGDEIMVPAFEQAIVATMRRELSITEFSDIVSYFVLFGQRERIGPVVPWQHLTEIDSLLDHYKQKFGATYGEDLHKAYQVLAKEGK